MLVNNSLESAMLKIHGVTYTEGRGGISTLDMQ